MKKKYVIKSLETNLYFYGFYSEKYWCAEIYNAKFFDSFEEIEQFISDQLEDIQSNFVEIITVYTSDAI